LIAFDFKSNGLRDKFLQKCFYNKLLLNKAGERTIRIRPNLDVSKKEIDKFISIIIDGLK